MKSEDRWFLRLQHAFKKVLEETCSSDWGYNVTNNWGFEADIVEEFNKMPQGSLRLQERLVTAHGIEISAGVGDALTSLPEISQAVFHLLYSVGETLFVVLPMSDAETLRYWFVIGCPTHGHIGEIIIQRKDIPQIDLSALDREVSSTKGVIEA